MNKYAKLIIATSVVASTLGSTQLGFAGEPNPQKPISTFTTRALPNGEGLSSSVVRQIQSSNKRFTFQNTTCEIADIKGCRVTSSSNERFPVGYIFKAIVQNKNQVLGKNSSLYQSSSWLNFVGEGIGIVLFVWSAPAMTPAILVASVYGIGIGSILIHA